MCDCPDSLNYKVVVKAKHTCVEGLFFQERHYYLILFFPETGEMVEREVPSLQYYTYEEGKEYEAVMYHSKRTHKYYFSPYEAKIA